MVNYKKKQNFTGSFCREVVIIGREVSEGNCRIKGIYKKICIINLMGNFNN
jgi:hypothetical protein